MRTKLLILLAMALAIAIGMLIGSTSQGTAMVSPLHSWVLYLPIVESPSVVPEQGAGATYGDCNRIMEAGLEWFYDWSTDPPVCPGVERVAMIWGKSSVGAIVDTEWVMGFNEPEWEFQANITPTLAAELWYQIEQDYPDKKLVSPAASLSWLKQWHTVYESKYGRPPRMDAVAHHCYGPWDVQTAVATCTTSVDAVVEWAMSIGVGAVWVTEFAMLPCWPEGEAGSIEFMERMVAHYRSIPEITRWAYFQTSYRGDEPWSFGPSCNTSLVDFESGELTPLGVVYSELGKGGRCADP